MGNELTRTIDINLIHPDTQNARKHIDLVKLRELADSILERGVLQPIIVRRVGENNYRIVAGERRWRACRIICGDTGKFSIPASVYTVNEKEAGEIALVENLQRQDLAPLEEAEGYYKLHTKHGESIEEIAAQVGKSKSYVHKRIRLMELPAEMREALKANRVGLSTALLVARIPDKLTRAKATSQILHPEYRKDVMDHEEAKEMIQDKFMLAISSKPWGSHDQDLYPKAGACSACPKRTSTQQDLFSDVGKHDLCLDRTCFDKKMELYNQKAIKEAERKGQTVLNETASRRVFSKGRTSTNYSCGYVLTNEDDYDVGKKASAIAKIESLVPVLAVDGTGRLRKLFKSSDISRIKQKHFKSKMSRISPNERASQRKKKFEWRSRQETIRRAIAQVRIKAARNFINTRLLKILTQLVADVHLREEQAKRICAARNIQPSKRGYGAVYNKAVNRLIEGMTTEKELLAILCEVLMTQGAGWESFTSEYGKPVVDLVKYYGGKQLSQIRREVVKDMKSKKRGKKK